MGNCYNVINQDEDILSNYIESEKIKTKNKLSANDMIIKKDNYDNNKSSNINIISEYSNDMNYISKTKLKLTIKQSKNLKEGNEYIKAPQVQSTFLWIWMKKHNRKLFA